MPIPILLRIEGSGPELSGTSDFPQQRRFGIALRELSFRNDTLNFVTRSFGEYSGRLADDGASIAGAFHQEGRTHALALRLGAEAQEDSARPQTPVAPFGYEVRQLYLDNMGAHCRLAGTLTLPGAKKTRAVALLITGSGAMDRDETVFGHKPFWVLADYLSRNGYAVLRLDDRGVGESSGDRSTITMSDEVADMESAVEYLRSADELRGLPIGLVGHSMGSLVGMMLASKSQSIAFLVAMAGPAFSLGEVFAERECQELRKSGIGEDSIGKHRRFTRALYRNLSQRAFDDPIDEAQITAMAESFDALQTANARNNGEWIARFNQPWFRSATCLDPADFLSRVTVPFLAINGSLDVQVPSAPNLAEMRALLQASGHLDFKTVELPGLNHLFQTCTDGAVYLYPVIEETFAPLALEAILAWLDARFQLRTT